MLIFIGDPGKHVQSILLLGVDHGSAGCLFPRLQVDQSRHHGGGPDVHRHSISFSSLVPLEFRQIPLIQDGMCSLLLQDLNLQIPQDLDHTGKPDPLIHLFRL